MAICLLADSVNVVDQASNVSPVSVLRRAGPQRFRKALICGVGRSGTTAVASVLAELGFNLGEHPVDPLREDTHLRELLLRRDADQLITELEAWSRRHAAVAWKDPKIHSAVTPAFMASLPADWLILAVFRDPLAITQRRMDVTGVPLMTTLRDVSRFQQKLLNFIDASAQTVALISYERFMAQTPASVQALQELVATAGGPPDPHLVAERARQHQRRYLDSIHPTGAPRSTT